MASRDAVSGAASHAGRATSCTACRQVKLRCDARATFPAPCSRCVSKKYSCRMDSNFKRTPARRRLEQVTGELNKYQEMLSRQPQGIPTTTATPSLSDPSPRLYQQSSTASYTAESPASTLDVFTSGVCFAPDESDHGGAPYELGDHRIRRLTVAELFSEYGWLFKVGEDRGADGNSFHKYYYPHFAILDTRMLRGDLIANCPILFWTIVIIAARSSPSHAGLYHALRPAYEQLLASNIIKVIRSVSSLHAIIMLIMWPLPYPGPSHDPSWGYCGLAVNAALQMGLHRPGFHREYGFPDLTPEQSALRTVTWMVCFQTSVWFLSTFLGLPPFVDSTAHMDAIMAKAQGLPRVLMAQTEIQLHVSRFTQALDGANEPAARLGYINMFDRDLERVRGNFQDTWTEEIELNLLSAKLYLYSHSFVAGKQSLLLEVSGSHLDSSARVILVSGLSTAVQYIHSFSQLDQSTSSPFSAGASQDLAAQTNRQMHVPHHYFRTLAFSSFFLLKFLAIAPDATESDKILARNHLTQVHSIFMSFSDSKEHLGVAMTIETLGKTNVASEGKVQTRLGASILYDALLNFSQLEKAKAAAAKDNLESGSGALDSTISEGDQNARDAALIAEYLNANWDMMWDTNFFDMGMEFIGQ